MTPQIINHYLIPDWPAPKNVHAYTTLRHGGHSLPPFDSFNMGARDKDNLEHVTANREQLRQELNLPSEPFWLKQVHGNRVVSADADEGKYPEADASLASQPKSVCIVLTADCLPIFLCSKAGTKAAVIHAGWRGLAKGVIVSTLNMFKTKPEETLAWLGPAIGPTAFEVGEEVYLQFLSINPQNTVAFKKGNMAGKWMANIYTLAKIQLNQQGITEIFGGNFCTYTDKERFFSHRRDQGLTGRMANLIWLS